MAKVKHALKVIAYGKDFKEYGTITLRAYTYDEMFKTYLGYVELLSEGKFNHVSRLDLACGRRVLFSFSSLRHVVNQLGFTIKINEI